MPRRKDANGKEIRPKGTKRKTKQTTGSQNRKLAEIKGTARHLAYRFTLHNYTAEEEYWIASATRAYDDPEGGINYLDYGKEFTKEDGPHLQGQVEFLEKRMLYGGDSLPP